MTGLTVGEAAKRTGWSPRMLRYLEREGLVAPRRTPGGYRSYGIRELNQLASLRELRRGFGVEIGDLAFLVRLRADTALRAAVDSWFGGSDLAAPGRAAPAWMEWEQRKHEKLIAA